MDLTKTKLAKPGDGGSRPEGRGQDGLDAEQIIWRAAGLVGLDPRPFTWRQLNYLAAGKRLAMVQQAGLVWADRGEPAYQRYVATGSFGDSTSDVQPYNADLVRQIVASGRLC
jgi:hypothetical protein